MGCDPSLDKNFQHQFFSHSNKKNTIHLSPPGSYQGVERRHGEKNVSKITLIIEDRRDNLTLTGIFTLPLGEGVARLIT